MTLYKILWHYDLKALEQDIQEHLNTGWSIAGNINVTKLADKDVVFQPVVKYANKLAQKPAEEP